MIYWLIIQLVRKKERKKILIVEPDFTTPNSWSQYSCYEIYKQQQIETFINQMINNIPEKGISNQQFSANSFSDLNTPLKFEMTNFSSLYQDVGEITGIRLFLDM